MKNNFFNKNLSVDGLKTVSVIAFTCLLTDYAFAVPQGVAAVTAIGGAIMPYVKWLTTIGGSSIVLINGWRAFNGQPKAGLYALGGGVVAGLGFDAIFGEDVATLMLP